MANVEVWPTVHAERKALASDLEGLSDDRWVTTSLCPQWTVRDVLAHMTATAKISPPVFFSKMVGAGFSLKKMQSKDMTVERGDSPTETLARFKEVADWSRHPPGPNDSWLGEVLVHSEDIRRPLGISHLYPTGAVIEVADFYKRSNMIIGTKRRIDGLRLEATDTEWSHGDGPLVKGPIMSLLMAMTGRRAPMADLSGDGVTTLEARA
jgi:uncharacterized protein (TIGR03083 family)